MILNSRLRSVNIRNKWPNSFTYILYDLRFVIILTVSLFIVVSEFIVFWIQSIHTYSSERAPVILIWTHADKVENAVNKSTFMIFITHVLYHLCILFELISWMVNTVERLFDIVQSLIISLTKPKVQLGFSNCLSVVRPSVSLPFSQYVCLLVHNIQIVKDS